jgi:hypothetical protein
MTAFGAILSSQALSEQIIITANQFRSGVTAPSDVTIGTTPTVDALQFAATNELVSTFFPLPFNMDRTIDPALVLIWSLAATEVNNDQLSITLDYTAPIELSTGDGVAKASTQLTDDLTVTTANGLAIGDIYTQAFSFAVADATNPLANAIGLAIEFHLTNLVGVAVADLIGACLAYEREH